MIQLKNGGYTAYYSYTEVVYGQFHMKICILQIFLMSKIFLKIEN